MQHRGVNHNENLKQLKLFKGDQSSNGTRTISLLTKNRKSKISSDFPFKLRPLENPFIMLTITPPPPVHKCTHRPQWVPVPHYLAAALKDTVYTYTKLQDTVHLLYCT